MDENRGHKSGGMNRRGTRRIEMSQYLSQSWMEAEPPSIIRRALIDAYIIAICAAVMACLVLALAALLHLFGHHPVSIYALELVILAVCGTFALLSFLLAR